MTRTSDTAIRPVSIRSSTTGTRRSRFSGVSTIDRTMVEHHGVDDSNGGGRERHTGQPTGSPLPPHDIVSHQSRAKERSEKAGQADRHGLLPFRAEYAGVELDAGEEGEHDAAGSGQKGDPLRLGSESAAASQRANHELRDGADNNLGEGGGDPEPVGHEDRDQRQQKPKCRDKPNPIHPGISRSSVLWLAGGTWRTLPQRNHCRSHRPSGTALSELHRYFSFQYTTAAGDDQALNFPLGPSHLL